MTMPVLESTDKIIPRSALRHRPIAGDATLKEQLPPVTNPTTPIVKRASRLRQPDTGDEVPEWQRADGSDAQRDVPAKTKQTGPSSPPMAKLSSKASSTMRTATKAKKQAYHPLVYLGIGMVSTISLFAVVISLSHWVSTTLDDLQYGRPRTFQIDAYVGHHEPPGMPSHFIALNLHGRIEIIELPGGDATHARIYLGPQLYGTDADLVPVTLSFMDVNGDHRPDMIIHFQGTQIVFINDQGGFRPLRPEERSPAEQFLRGQGQ
jgi:hypothetical protein